ncbi:hypothetical protein AB0F15_16010 [Amycolatopsis sp. NPDC026612]
MITTTVRIRSGNASATFVPADFRRVAAPSPIDADGSPDRP